MPDSPRSAALRMRLPGIGISHREVDGVTAVVTVEGDVDLAAAPTLKSKLLELLAHGYRRFVLDLSQVVHMDSTGLGVLVGFRRRLSDEGSVAIACAPVEVLVLFEVTGLVSAFEPFPTVADALARASASPAPERRAVPSADAAIVLGLAATAIPFADCAVAEAERWLRILRSHGEAGRALSALGLSETPLVADGESASKNEADCAERCHCDVITSVTEQAVQAAGSRGSSTVGTADVLMAVMDVYGEDFDRVLQRYGSDHDEVYERLGGRLAAVTSAR